MDLKRIVLYFALALVGVMLWNSWQLQHRPAAVATQQQSATQQTPKSNTGGNTGKSFTPGTFAPSNKQLHARTAHSRTTGALTKGKYVTVKTDVLNVAINLTGGNIVDGSLRKYSVSLQQQDKPVQILNSNPSALYIAQSGLTNTSGSGTAVPIEYITKQTHFVLASGKNEIVVELVGTTSNGLHVTKTLTFKRDHYVVDVKYVINNKSSKAWKGSVYYQLTRTKPEKKSSLHSRAYNGASISGPHKPYEKISYKNMDQRSVSRVVKGGWVAMQQQYFLSSWIPKQSKSHMFYSHVTIGNAHTNGYHLYTIGYETPQVTLNPGVQISNASKIYIGPEIGKRLRPIAHGLDLTIDYGWLWPLSKFLFWMLSAINKVLHNWGWSIVFLTLLIKIAFYWFSGKSYKSMAKMREVQPRIQTLRDRHKDDKQALSKAMMEFYKKEKVNPMGGCLPMLVQIPVFIALYYMLIESVQLRQAPFMFWIHDLSVKDPYYVLPVLMGLSMFLQQKISPPPPDPTQAKLMMLMPVALTVFFLSFPAGLVLYWLTNNLLSVAQQYYVLKTYNPKAVPKKKKRKK